MIMKYLRNNNMRAEIKDSVLMANAISIGNKSLLLVMEKGKISLKIVIGEFVLCLIKLKK